MRIRKLASVDRRLCVSCGTCELNCPKEAIRIWKGCWAVVSSDACIGCKKCSRVCPADCITLMEREEAGIA